MLTKEQKQSGLPIEVRIIDPNESEGRALAKGLEAYSMSASWIPAPQPLIQSLYPAQFQVIVMELNYRSTDGIAAIQKIRSIDPEVVIVVLTSSANLKTAVAALRANVSDYCVKPLSPKGLSKIVYDLLCASGYLLPSDDFINRGVGRRVRQYRLWRQLSITQLARQTQLSKSLISQLENAKNAASLYTLVKIARCLRVSPAILLQDL